VAKVWKKQSLRITVDRALGERLSEGVWRRLDRMLVADARLRELVPGEPSEEASQPRSRKARKNRGSGSKRLPARVVLRRIWPEGYPTRAEVSDADLWDRFVKEWDRVEGKRPPTKFNKIPSNSTVLRETGRKD
jgi:hypothetical protein